jgi:hypothetical protein
MMRMLHRSNKVFSSTVFAALCFIAGADSTRAQSSYKCEADGKVSYQATPCAGGKVIGAAAQPTAAQKRQAVEEDMRNEQAVKGMAADRKIRERQKTKTGLGEIGTMKATSMEEREGVKINKKKGKAHKAKRSPKASVNKAPKASKPKKSGQSVSR